MLKLSVLAIFLSMAYWVLAGRYAGLATSFADFGAATRGAAVPSYLTSATYPVSGVTL